MQAHRVRVGGDVKFFEATEDKPAAAYVNLVEPKWHRNDDGTFVEVDPVWYDAKLYGKPAEVLNESFKKGDSLVVMGESKVVRSEVEGKQYTKNELSVKTFGPDIAYESVSIDRSARDAARAARSAAQETTQEQSQAVASDAEVDQAAARIREEATKAALLNQASSMRTEVSQQQAAMPSM